MPLVLNSLRQKYLGMESSSERIVRCWRLVLELWMGYIIWRIDNVPWKGRHNSLLRHDKPMRLVGQAWDGQRLWFLEEQVVFCWSQNCRLGMRMQTILDWHAKKIQSELSLKQESVPFSNGKGRITSCQTSQEMVLECSDSTFGCIALMNVRGNKLLFKAVLFETLFEVGRCFIVKNVQFWLIATLCKVLMNAGPTTFDFGSSFILESDY